MEELYDYLNDLVSLSQVCRYLKPIAYDILYYEVVLLREPKSGNDLVELFRRTITEHPELGLLVRLVRIEGPTERYSKPLGFDMSLFPKLESLTLDDVIIEAGNIPSPKQCPFFCEMSLNNCRFRDTPSEPTKAVENDAKRLLTEYSIMERSPHLTFSGEEHPPLPMFSNVLSSLTSIHLQFSPIAWPEYLIPILTTIVNVENLTLLPAQGFQEMIPDPVFLKGLPKDSLPSLCQYMGIADYVPYFNRPSLEILRS
ncbi:hypothetical protein M422DRAFT_31947 [Sphaerobolus stellatus SS14]|uniref:F-box domain-containing protein n=1 Tax=Sphaerobolus stellatus (strain SS14) TaxID=990650 RepID=A0A0C9VRT7_SPHS4|nr:hypothetical protein M422DRAFT_31947 [Sphaerobolus stellatus SS14]